MLCCILSIKGMFYNFVLETVICFDLKKKADTFFLSLYNIKVYINKKYVQEYSSSKTMLVYFFHGTVVVFILLYAMSLLDLFDQQPYRVTVSGDKLVSSVV